MNNLHHTLWDKFVGWVSAVIFVCAIGWIIWVAQQPDPQAEKIAQEKKAKWKAERLQNELKYEEKFWKTDTGPTVLGRVMAPNGGIITGRLLFIPECPIGYWCVQPDTAITDEDGNDITSPPAAD